MKVTCAKKCFYDVRVWEVGEELTIPKGTKIPTHFISEAQSKKLPKKKKAFEDDPRTLKEAQDRQKKTGTLE